MLFCSGVFWFCIPNFSVLNRVFCTIFSELWRKSLQKAGERLMGFVSLDWSVIALRTTAIDAIYHKNMIKFLQRILSCPQWLSYSTLCTPVRYKPSNQPVLWTSPCLFSCGGLWLLAIPWESSGTSLDMTNGIGCQTLWLIFAVTVFFFTQHSFLANPHKCILLAGSLARIQCCG